MAVVSGVQLRRVEDDVFTEEMDPGIISVPRQSAGHLRAPVARKPRPWYRVFLPMKLILGFSMGAIYYEFGGKIYCFLPADCVEVRFVDDGNSHVTEWDARHVYDIWSMPNRSFGRRSISPFEDTEPNPFRSKPIDVPKETRRC